MYYKILKPYTYLDKDKKIQVLEANTFYINYNNFNLNKLIIENNPDYFQLLTWDEYISGKYGTVYNGVINLINEHDLDLESLYHLLEYNNLLFFDAVYDKDENLGIIAACLRNGNYDLRVGYKTDCYNEIEKTKDELTKLKKDTILKWNSDDDFYKYKFIKFIKPIDHNFVLISIYEYNSNFTSDVYQVMLVHDFLQYKPCKLSELSTEDLLDKFFNNKKSIKSNYITNQINSDIDEDEFFN